MLLALPCAFACLFAASQPAPEAAFVTAQPQARGHQVIHRQSDPEVDLLLGSAATLDVEGCVDHALQNSAKLEEADAKVRFFEARLAEMDATGYPKIMATAFLAPMYTVRGDGFEREPTIRYKQAKDWGPYLNFEARVVQPLYAFGRGDAARRAARGRAGVERARLEEVMQTIARETRKLYYLRLYALSMQPALANAHKLLQDAAAKAESMHKDGTGDVTQVDLARLAYGAAELDRRIAEAALGVDLSLSALKQVMGLSEQFALEQADRSLQVPTQAQLARDVEPLPSLLAAAAVHRPEWAELQHGQQAAQQWARAERLAMLPQLLFVGQLNFAYTPTRDKDPNPWHYDIYNRRTAGFALVLKFDLDAGTALAKAKQGTYTQQQVSALYRYASTGIPLEVRAAHQSLLQLRETLASTQRGVEATRRWMRFAATALAAGTGEARDLLEGTATYLQAKQAQMSTVQAYYGKLAELSYAIGRGRHLVDTP